MLWAYDGDHMIKGLMKFAADLVPSGPFYHLLSVKQKVRVGAPIVKPTDDDKHEGKFIPIIMTHGVGNTMSWFSTICKDFASQGHIVFSMEHNDETALHFYNDNNENKYYKQVDMRNINKFIQKLGIRTRELDGLISELVGMTKNQLANDVELDMTKLTIVGHGFGGTTAVTMASKDYRIKKVLTFDPWLPPIKDEIENGDIKLKQAFCAINSEMFKNNVPDNEETINILCVTNKAKGNNLVSTLKDMGHLAFTDLPLIL